MIPLYWPVKLFLGVFFAVCTLGLLTHGGWFIAPIFGFCSYLMFRSAYYHNDTDPWMHAMRAAKKAEKKRAREPVNKKQSIVLWVGALIIAVMALYPPWKYVCSKYSIEKIALYDFVFSPPEIPGKKLDEKASLDEKVSLENIQNSVNRMYLKEELKKEGFDFDRYPRDMWAVQVDWYRLVLPVGAVGLLTIALTLTFRVQGSVKE